MHAPLALILMLLFMACSGAVEPVPGAVTEAEAEGADRTAPAPGGETGIADQADGSASDPAVDDPVAVVDLADERAHVELEAAKACGWHATRDLPPSTQPTLDLVMKGDVEGLRQALTEGADPDARDDRLALTPLVAAIEAACGDAIALLLEAGADPNVTAEGGYPPLMMAVRQNEAELTVLLLERGADPSLLGPEFHDALIEGVFRRSEAAVAVLLDAGVDLTGRPSAHTPVDAAVVTGSVKMLDLLVAAGAELDPALFYFAIVNDDARMVAALVERGVDPAPPVQPPKTMTGVHRDPAVYARQQGYDHLVPLLGGQG